MDWDAGFWVFNQVANFAYQRYSDMIKDIQVVQAELEGKFLAAQPEIDAAALALYEQAPRLAKDYLTDYSAQSGATVIERWKELSNPFKKPRIFRMGWVRTSSMRSSKLIT